MALFPSDEWAKAMCEVLNQSEAYAKAAANWEGDICLIIKADGPLKEDAYLYADLWHGKCREARQLNDPSEVQSAFTISGSYRDWCKVIEGKLDPVRGLMTRKFHLKGDMGAIMRNVKAANALVAACAQVPTEFLEE